MNILKCADRMQNVHSDIRGPLFVEAMEMRANGVDVLRLNTGNPATFGFGLPESIRKAIEGHEDKGVGYCDFKGMPDAREAIAAYHRKTRYSSCASLYIKVVFPPPPIRAVIPFCIFKS